jgi:hypothetical protein
MGKLSSARRIDGPLQQGQLCDLTVSSALGDASAGEQRHTLGAAEIFPNSKDFRIGSFARRLAKCSVHEMRNS